MTYRLHLGYDVYMTKNATPVDTIRQNCYAAQGVEGQSDAFYASLQNVIESSDAEIVEFFDHLTTAYSAAAYAAEWA